MMYILVPAHNRREITAKCVRTLAHLQLPHRTLVIDDGSTDGTAEAAALADSECFILRGDGNLWWGGAIHLGMKFALSHEDCTQILWLNDDCIPAPGTLEKLSKQASLLGGICVAKSRTQHGYVYGGRLKKTWGLYSPPATPALPVPVDTFTGNCVLIPRQTLDKIGLVDAASLPHHYCDSDFGLRARNAGIPIFEIPDAWCENDINENIGLRSWIEDSQSFSEIARSFPSYRSMMHWPSRRVFYVRHWGARGWAMAVAPYVKFAVIWLIASIIGRSNMRKIKHAWRKFRMGHAGSKR